MSYNRFYPSYFARSREVGIPVNWLYVACNNYCIPLVPTIYDNFSYTHYYAVNLFIDLWADFRCKVGTKNPCENLASLLRSRTPRVTFQILTVELKPRVLWKFFAFLKSHYRFPIRIESRPVLSASKLLLGRALIIQFLIRQNLCEMDCIVLQK